MHAHLLRLKEFAWNYRNLASMRGLYLGVIAGLSSGLLACAYYYLLEGASFLISGELIGLKLGAPAGEALFRESSGPSRLWLLPLLLGALGLATGLLIKHFMPESDKSGTDGTDAMILAFHQKQGRLMPFATLARAATSILTIACGGSAGREGPISLLGAGSGSFIAQKLKLSLKERRILLLAGAAGGLGAIFRAPLGGALTAIEVIYKEDFEAEAVLPAILSSVTSYSIFSLVFGSQPIFSLPELSFHGLKEIPFYVALALCCALGARYFVKCFRFIKYSWFEPFKSRLGLPCCLGLGGALMGFLGMAFPQLTGGGFGLLNQAFTGALGPLTMLCLFAGKTLATSLTVGSGLSGGTFAPALVCGGMLGGALGQFANEFWPNLVSQPQAFVLVGMAAFFSCAAKAPLGPVLMVCELSQGYGLLAPLMLAAALGLIFARGPSLYENQLACRFDSPAHRGELALNLLENLIVADYLLPEKPVILEENVNLAALLDILAGTSQHCFPVIAQNGELSGILRLDELRRLINEDTLYELLLVKDLAEPRAYLTLDQDLYSALLALVEAGSMELPVLGENGQGLVLGLLSQTRVLEAYQARLLELKECA